MLEKTVETYLVDRVRAAGGDAYKFSSPARVSVPDRIVIFPPARIYFVELKRPGGKPTRGQLREHERLRALGCDVRVIDSREAVDAFVQKVRDALISDDRALLVEASKFGQFADDFDQPQAKPIRAALRRLCAALDNATIRPEPRTAGEAVFRFGDDGVCRVQPDDEHPSIALAMVDPCPFCGSENVDPKGWLANDGRSGPACDDCGATAESVEGWNCRAQPEPQMADERVAFIPCPICNGVEGCDHTAPEREHAASNLSRPEACTHSYALPGATCEECGERVPNPADKAREITHLFFGDKASAARASSPNAAGHCSEGDGCVCGGDLPRVREGCANWVKP
ncbi:hypothetical protein [Burkholderia contaminans]|uniref:hypothetical protein n=1 Tax=Burkholderia contaminans TaxID=488447 RepID=UPI001ABA2907|nr:hypothetical protein [Burkholderia contaminans]